MMNKNHFILEEMTKIDFSISHTCIDSNSPLNTNESHFHEACEIYLNLSGNVLFEVENRIYPISRGSVIITRPYEYHHCIYRSNQPHEHYWITFSAGHNESFLNLFFNREKGTDNLILLNNSQLTDMCIVLKKLLKHETDSLNRRIAFLTMMQILINGKRDESIESLEHMQTDVIAALQYMDLHLTEELDIHSIASSSNVSINTLERHFKETLGITPSAMLRKKRLIYSMKHLRNGSSVSEAAMKSGFTDYSNYIHLFRKQFGMTPLQYKKSL